MYTIRNFPFLQLAPDPGLKTHSRKAQFAHWLHPLDFSPLRPYPQGHFWFFQGEGEKEGWEGMEHVSLNWPGCSFSHRPLWWVLRKHNHRITGSFPSAVAWCGWCSFGDFFFSWCVQTSGPTPGGPLQPPSGGAGSLQAGLLLPLADVCLLPWPSPSVRASRCLRARVINQDMWPPGLGKIIRFPFPVLCCEPVWVPLESLDLAPMPSPHCSYPLS